jgi:hypothetical protein
VNWTTALPSCSDGNPVMRNDNNSIRLGMPLGLKNNDALWLVLMALQHYQDQYERFPNAIALAAKETLASFKETADTMIIASAEATKADLAKAVVKTAQDVANHNAQKQMWQWAAGCLAVGFLTFSLFGWYIHSKAYEAGYNSGYGVGYARPRTKKPQPPGRIHRKAKPPID